MKLIHVGVGGRGGHWLDFVKGRHDVETVACVDVDAAALQRVAEQTGCATFSSLPEALASVQADGVLVASPSPMHGAHALEALQAGFSVLVEKPLAGNLAEAVDVVQAADKAGRTLMVAENYRFFRAERTLRRYIDEVGVGAIEAVECIDRRDQPSAVQGAWVKSMPQPFLTEIAVHHFDSFRYLFDRQPMAIWAHTYNPAGSDYGQNAAAQTLIDMAGGLSIQYSGSFVGSRYEYSLRVIGERGEVRTDRNRVWSRKPGHRSFTRVAPVALAEGEALKYPAAGMLAMLEQFRAALGGGPDPETSGRDNLWTLAMFEAAVQSAATGRFVSVDETFTPELRVRAGIVEES
jgi:predicted dehydrogenase